MAVTRIDNRHWTAVVKSGTQATTSSVEVSADGKVMKIEGQGNGKSAASTQFWDRQ
jgi:hypothetical protein